MLLWNLIFFIFFFIYKIETGKIRPNFDEIFGNKWDKNESEEQLIKIEQNEQNENINFVDQLDEEHGNGPNDQQKIETINKFEAIQEKLREKGNFQSKDRSKIEVKIGKLLGANRRKIYKWKKELNLNKNEMKMHFYNKKKKEFMEQINEFKSLYGQGKQKEFVNELGITERTFWKWKKELVPKYIKKNYTNEDKLRIMDQYFQIKETDSKFSDKQIAKQLGIGSETLRRWKKELASISNP